MISASDKYKELFSLLDDWKIKLPPLQQVIAGKYEITQDAAFAFTQVTCAFNRETYDVLRRTAKDADGFKIILLDTSTDSNLSLIRRAFLYTDLIVVYSGSSTALDFDVDLIQSLKDGGLLCENIVEWFRDLVTFRPLLESGHALCVQKNYFDLYPERRDGRWVLSNVKPRILPAKRNNNNATVVNPLSLYFDLVNPSNFDCTFAGSDFVGWKTKLLSSFKSINDASFGALLNFELPYLDQIPLDVLVKLKNDDEEAFKRFRVALKNAIQECLKFDVQSEPIENLAKHIHKTYIEPEVEEVKKKLDGISKMKSIRRSGAAIRFLSLTFNALLGNVFGVLIDSLSIGHTGIEEIVKIKEEKSLEKRNEMYLLWKLKQLSTKK